MARPHLTLAAASLFVLAAAAPAHADQTARVPGEQVSSYKVVMDVQRDGDVRISETIDYDFGQRRRHGIYRYIPDLVEQDDGRVRRYSIDDIEVSSPTGAPDRADVEREDDRTFIRIGDPDKWVEGRHTYVIEYVIRGGLTPFDDHDELYWDAVGDDWKYPITSINVEVKVPAEVTEAACFQGRTGSTEQCGSANATGGTATFTQRSLDPRRGLTVRVRWPKGAVAVAEPDYVKGRWAFTPITLFGLPLLLLIPLIYRAAGPRKGSGLVSLGMPPEGVPPGPAGALLSGGPAHGPHVIAVLVDLAARGHLRIEAAPSGADWRLVRQGGLPAGLAPYEETLLRSLFTGRDQVWVSELKYKFAGPMRMVRRQISAELVRLGWMRFSVGRGIAMFLPVLLLSGIGAVVFWPMSRVDGTGWAAAGLTLSAVLALVAMLVARPLTPLGWDVATQLRRMQETLRHQAPVHTRDPEAMFSALMPYAVTFGLAGAFASQFAALGQAMPQVGWWHGPYYDPYHHGRSPFDDFSSSAASTLSATVSSSSGSSGGFSGGGSGGGGGGGGGGSW